MNIIDILMGPTFGKVLDRLLPDPQAKAAAQMELLKMQQAGDLAQLDSDTRIALAQADINKVEAGSESRFKSFWRPFIGWVCGAALAVQFILAPFLSWGSRLAGHPLDFPTLDMATLMPLVMALLGLGALRTTEKVKGVA